MFFLPLRPHNWAPQPAWAFSEHWSWFWARAISANIHVDYKTTTTTAWGKGNVLVGLGGRNLLHEDELTESKSEQRTEIKTKQTAKTAQDRNTGSDRKDKTGSVCFIIYLFPRFFLVSNLIPPLPLLPHSRVSSFPPDLQLCICISLQTRHILSALASSPLPQCLSFPHPFHVRDFKVKRALWTKETNGVSKSARGKGNQMKSRAVEWEAGIAAAQFVPGIACAEAVRNQSS